MMVFLKETLIHEFDCDEENVYGAQAVEIVGEMLSNGELDLSYGELTDSVMWADGMPAPMCADRMENIINRSINWTIDCGGKHTRDLIRAMGITQTELRSLGWEEDSLGFINEIEQDK